MRTPIAAQLKLATAEVHQRVEAGLGLLDPALRTTQVRAVLELFAGFWPATESRIDDWAARHPTASSALDWRRRRRGPVIAADLTALGRPTAWLARIPQADPVFDNPGTADVLGWLYVSEGSTLGGAVIHRGLQRDAVLRSVRAFTPYAEGPGPMWRAYLTVLGEWVDSDPRRCDAVVDAGVRTFAALETWLRPAFVRSAV